MLETKSIPSVAAANNAVHLIRRPPARTSDRPITSPDRRLDELGFYPVQFPGTKVLPDPWPLGGKIHEVFVGRRERWPARTGRIVGIARLGERDPIAHHHI